MTATIERPIASPPMWELATASFLPHSDSQPTRRLVRALPLAVILLVQLAFSLRLYNSAFQDEALYLFTGSWERLAWAGGGKVYSNPSTFFSGAPQLYPVFASYLNSIGGLWLARFFSTLCMLSATGAVYWMTHALFHRQNPRRTALLAALVFMLSGPVLFLGHFATYDAVSFTCIAWAAAVAAWSSVKNRSLWFGVLVGTLAALAVLLKYSSATDVPFVMLLAVVGWQRGRRLRTVLRGAIAGLTTLAILAASIVTWAKDDYAGFKESTLSRHVFDATPALTLSKDVATWTGITMALMLLGGVLLFRRRPLLAAALTCGTLAATAYQINTGELTSLHKHVVLGLVLGAPLAGYLLSQLMQRNIGVLVVMLSLWVTTVVGLQQSEKLFSVWPNTSRLVDMVNYSVKAYPTIRMLGDTPEPLEYALWDKTQYWQWTATYNNSFYYHGKTDLPAYELALKRGYFQLVFLDYSTPLSRRILGLLPNYHYKKSATVTAPDGHKWTVWTRFKNIATT